MSLSYSRAPHVKGAPGAQSEAPNAALLIDFDNVTMGMRSDLSKELKNLLNSDIIKGKVTVQRAYADWRRYPQYIVPLSENSVDLIFAPAYGSSKKNATDIRMAIDAMELVFIRPEIGTFILLTGDSDFSSVVLKLKEYGKYVIGVGIQESSSDILVQNCDEYYSYTSIAGLRKTTDSAVRAVDPWILVEQAVDRMGSRDDVMRSDRLKQVMIEIDPSFDEGNFGYSKFSKFLAEAAGRDLVRLKKLENGQYEVLPAGGRRAESGSHRGGEPRKAEGRERPRGREDREPAGKAKDRPPEDSRPDGRKPEEPRIEARRGEGFRAGAPSAEVLRGEARKDEEPAGASPGEAKGGDPLQAAYGLLRRALGALASGDGSAVRDSDLKRKMLELEPSFDEGELGFGKFSRFLRQAHDHEIVDVEKREEGTYQVSSRAAPAVDKGAPAGKPAETTGKTAPPSPEQPEKAPEAPGAPAGKPVQTPRASPEKTRGLRMRRGGTRARREPEGPPPLLEGQVVAASGGKAPPADRGARAGGRSTDRGAKAEKPSPSPFPSLPDPTALGLPTEGPAMIRYLTHRYKGVGQKTAESLVKEFGPGLYQVMQSNPDRIRKVIPANRAEQVLSGWQADLARRQVQFGSGSESQPKGREGASDAGPAPAPAGAPGSGGGTDAGSAAAPAGSTGHGRPADPEPPTSPTAPEGGGTTSSRRRTRKGGRGRGRAGAGGTSGGSGREARDAGAGEAPGGGLLLDLE
jgi:uncharacterized protein (TIGR00288 family)